jgi:hypothetical protein
MAFYDGNKPGGVPGLLPATSVGSYNWWEAGALWGQVRKKLEFRLGVYDLLTMGWAYR